MSGWIKLKRTIFEHWIASDNEYLSVWVRMLSEANFEDKTKLFNGALITVRRGQVVFGLQAWSEKTGVQISKLRRLISMLERDSMISRQVFNKYSLISIVNYDLHQSDDRQVDSQIAGKQQAESRQTATPKEVKNIISKEVKDIVDSGESPAAKPPCKATEVFEHWKLVMAHPRAVLDEKRVKLIKKWLKAGYSPETLMDSITGYTHSPHHMGQNESGTKYDSIELLLRDAGKIDAGLKHLETVNNPGESNVYKTNSRLNRHERVQQWSVDATASFERQLAEIQRQEDAAAGNACDQEFIPYLPDVDS